MPLFKKHHDAPVDSTNYPSMGANDPNYTGANAAYGGPTSTGYSSNANTYAGAPPASHSSGVGAPVDNSYGTQSGPGAEVGGITGHQAPHQYNQPGTGHGDTGYGDTGYGDTGYSGTGYADQPGTFNPVRNEVGGPGAAPSTGHHVGGYGGTGAAAGGLAGGNVHNTTAASASTGNTSTKGATSLEMKGKAQQLAGIVLSSQSMKSKGYAKEQEAAAIRHEGQARLARERAGQGPYH